MLDLKNQNRTEKDSLNASSLPLEWRAHEYVHQEKSKQWFLGVGIVGGGISLFSVILGNFLFAFLTILVIGLLFIYEVRGPKEYDYAITSRGLKMNNRIFEYPNLRSFWIFEHENGENELSVESKKQFVPHIKIPIGDTDLELIRTVLKRFLPESHQEEGLTEILARRFGL